MGKNKEEKKVVSTDEVYDESALFESKDDAIFKSNILHSKEELKEPEKIADSIYKNKSPSDTQLRKFFDDFMILKKHADTIYSSSDEAKDRKFEKEILPLIKFSKIKIVN